VKNSFPAHHLLYFVTPYGNWESNLFYLKQYISTFQGERLCCVAEGKGLLSREESSRILQRFFSPQNIFFIPNDLELRETPGFFFLLKTLLARVPLNNEKDKIFFAHTKGVSHQPSNLAVRLWTELLYRRNLEDISLVENQLRSKCITGCMRKFGNPKHFPDGCPWHYHGTFFWINVKALNARNWESKFCMHRYGAEAFPGITFSSEESDVLWYDNVKSCYKLKNVNRLIKINKREESL